ncbi:hypothetical protein [Streptomyces clavifer]|uniref:hypothetical protein n=1 Tax=Streptomyces clavifer TaxID=68188 RepID=UPI0038189028
MLLIATGAPFLLFVQFIFQEGAMIPRQSVIASTAFLALLSLTSATSCSPSPGSDEVSPGGTYRGSGDHRGGKIIDRVAKPVPIEQYIISSRQWKTLTDAEYLLRTRCADHFGVDYKNKPPKISTGQTITDYRYGVIDPTYAAKYGYRTPVARESKLIEADIKRQDELYRNLPDNVFLVLHGATREEIESNVKNPKRRDYKGKEIPKAGCNGEARRKIYGSSVASDSQVANNINIKSYTASMQDRQVQVVFSKWSSCMKGRGYDYKVPRDADNDRRWMVGEATVVEKETAKADSECKLKFNVTGVWNKVDVANQEKLIREHSEEMTAAKNRIKYWIARANLELAKE